MKNEVEQIIKGTHLSSETIVDVTNNDTVVVSLFWGDWKHEHLYLENLMKQHGYYQVGENVTEEDGCDCYSSDHEFKKIA